MIDIIKAGVTSRQQLNIGSTIHHRIESQNGIAMGLVNGKKENCGETVTYVMTIEATDEVVKR